MALSYTDTAQKSNAPSENNVRRGGGHIPILPSVLEEDGALSVRSSDLSSKTKVAEVLSHKVFFSNLIVKKVYLRQ